MLVEIVTPVIFSGPSPLFVTVKSCSGDVVPSFMLVKAMLDSESKILGDAIPPDRLTT